MGRKPGSGRPENLTNKGKGRPKGAKNKCTRAKDDYFTVFFQMGGKKFLEKELKESKRNRGEFILRTLPSLMPKKTDIELSGKEGAPIEFTSIEVGAKLAYILEIALEKKKEIEEKSKPPLPK